MVGENSRQAPVHAGDSWTIGKQKQPCDRTERAYLGERGTVDKESGSSSRFMRTQDQPLLPSSDDHCRAVEVTPNPVVGITNWASHMQAD